MELHQGSCLFPVERGGNHSIFSAVCLDNDSLTADKGPGHLKLQRNAGSLVLYSVLYRTVQEFNYLLRYLPVTAVTYRFQHFR